MTDATKDPSDENRVEEAVRVMRGLDANERTKVLNELLVDRLREDAKRPNDSKVPTLEEVVNVIDRLLTRSLLG